MYPKYVPGIVAEKSNRTSLDNNYGVINEVWPALAGGKKRGVKTGSNIKSNKTQEYWYLACEAYQTLASQDVSINMSSFLNSSHCSACFTGTKSEEKYFALFLVKFDSGRFESSAVIRGRRRKYVEIEKKLIRYLDLCAHKYTQDKCGVSRIFMEKKCSKFAEGLGLNDSKPHHAGFQLRLITIKRSGSIFIVKQMI